MHRPVPQARRRPRAADGRRDALARRCSSRSRPLIVALLFPFGEATLMQHPGAGDPAGADPGRGVPVGVDLPLPERRDLRERARPLVTARPVMVLPVDEPVEITLTSRDVIHSFFVPGSPVQARRDPGPHEHVHVHADGARDVPVAMRRVLRALAFEDDVRGEGRDARSTTRRGSSSSARRPRASPASPNGTDLSLVAHDISWNQFCLAVPADTPFTVEHRRTRTPGIEHNFSIYDSFFEETDLLQVAEDHRAGDRDARRPGRCRPGSYYFQCDVHGPAMSGAFIVAMSDADGRTRRWP